MESAASGWIMYNKAEKWSLLIAKDIALTGFREDSWKAVFTDLCWNDNPGRTWNSTHHVYCSGIDQKA